MYKAFTYTLLVSLVLLISCTKETIEVIPQVKNPAELKGKVTFKIDSENRLDEGLLFYRSGKDSTIQVVCKTDVDIIRIWVYDTLPGTYQVGKFQAERGTAFISYWDNPGSAGVPFNSTEGTITITSVGNGKASGSFNAKVLKSAGNKTATITDGIFSEVER